MKYSAHDKVILGGDFNARTGLESDFSTPSDSNFFELF